MTPIPASTSDRRVSNKMSRRRVRREPALTGGDERRNHPVDPVRVADLEEMDLKRLCDTDSIKMF